LKRGEQPVELINNVFAGLFISSFLALATLIYQYGIEREDEE
jgi:hypothetical protein